MAKVIHSCLFRWNDFEARTDMERLSLVLANLQDERIVQYLEVMRGNGRDDYPIRPMWNAVIAGIVFQHLSLASLIRELSRNPSLLAACGFDPVPIQRKPDIVLVRNAVTGLMEIVHHIPEEPRYLLPNAWNFSRFLRNIITLEETLGMVSELTVSLRQLLMDELPGFGTHLGYDGKAIASYSTGQINQETKQTSDPDADWGKHETHGIDTKTGKPWTKVKSWFGYGLHIIADTQHEIPVAFEVTPASHSEQTTLRKLIRTTFGESPALAERCQDFVADRGLDSAETKAMLLDEYQIRPIIDTRQLWQREKNAPGFDPSQPIVRHLFPERDDTIVFTEKGSLHCRCPVTQELRNLTFQGHEADRGTLKFRCPIAASGCGTCQGEKICHQKGGVQPGPFGRVIRVPLKLDRRIFVPTPYGTAGWERAYDRRSAMERINNRIDNVFGYEHHFIRGIAKMTTRIGLSVAVMMAMALGHVRAKRLEQIRSLVKPIPIAA
jgi:hypothetical protein